MSEKSTLQIQEYVKHRKLLNEISTFLVLIFLFSSVVILLPLPCFSQPRSPKSLLAQLSNQESYYNSSAIGLDSISKIRVNYTLTGGNLDYVLDYRTIGVSLPILPNFFSGFSYQHCHHFGSSQTMDGNQYNFSLLLASSHHFPNLGHIIPSIQLSYIKIDEFGKLHLSAGVISTYKNWLLSAYCNSLNSPGYYYPTTAWLKDSLGNYYESEPFLFKHFDYPRSITAALSYRHAINSITIAPYISLKNREWGYWMPNDLTWHYLGFGVGIFTKKLTLAYCYAEMNTEKRSHRLNCIAKGKYFDAILKVEIASTVDQFFLMYNQDLKVWASLGAVFRFQKRSNTNNWYDIMEIF